MTPYAIGKDEDNQECNEGDDLRYHFVKHNQFRAQVCAGMKDPKHSNIIESTIVSHQNSRDPKGDLKVSHDKGNN